MKYGGRRELRIAAGFLAVAAIQVVWYYAVILTMHMLYYDRPVQKSIDFGVVLYGVLFLPTLVTVVAAVVIGATRMLRSGRRRQ
ncbi:MAG: hypothetical protein HY906_08155 [Deltaproteobacteria bacterium]|nr:hypothetical protein [Deltaproteobacteria bacterium]